MDRTNLLLLVLDAAGGEPFSPVQLQKSLFLVTKARIPHLPDDGYEFEPYHYGPFSQQIYEDLSTTAKRTLQDKEVHNLELFVGDVMSGWQPEQAHDVVVVTGSVRTVPEHFRGWVNPGGRLFIVNGDAPAMEARLLTRLNASEWREESLFETDLPRLVNADQAPRFEF